MKAIVFISGDPHSAWDNIEEAEKQVQTLLNYGYGGIYKNEVYHKEIEHNYENGYYFN